MGGVVSINLRKSRFNALRRIIRIAPHFLNEQAGIDALLPAMDKALRRPSFQV
jgi:hypothetical protein